MKNRLEKYEKKASSRRLQRHPERRRREGSKRWLFALFACFLAQTSIALYAAPEARVCNENQTPGAAEKLGGDLRNIAGGFGDCRSLITTEEELMLSRFVGLINESYFAGDFTPEERDLEIERLLSRVNTQDPDKKGVLKAVIAQMNSLHSSEFVLGLTLKKLSGESISEKEEKIVEGLGIQKGKVDDYLSAVGKQYSPYYKSLKNSGIQFNAESGWDFSQAKLSPKTLKGDATFNTALMIFFSPQFAKDLSDAKRQEAIHFGDYVILPPQKEDFEEGKTRIYSKEEYDRIIKRQLEVFEEETNTFMLASKTASTYGNQMSGRVGELFGAERGHKGDSGDEIQKNDARKQMQIASDRINRMGAPKALRQALRNTMMAANNIDRANLKQGIAKLDLAFKAAIAAPFVPALMYAAPFAGGLISAKIAAASAKAAGALALLPLAFGLGSAAISAGIDTSSFGGSWFCHFAEELAEKGTGALTMAPFLAAIPSGAAVLSAGAGVTAGAFAWGSAGAVAHTTYGVLNIGVALKFLASMGHSGVTNLSGAYQKLLDAKEAAEAGDQELVNIHANDAYKLAAEGGIDLAFALSMAGRMGVEGYKGIRETKAIKERQSLAIRALGRLKSESLSEKEKSAIEQAYEEAQNGGNKQALKILLKAGFKEVDRRALADALRLVERTKAQKNPIRTRAVQKETDQKQTKKTAQTSEWDKLTEQEKWLSYYKFHPLGDISEFESGDYISAMDASGKRYEGQLQVLRGRQLSLLSLSGIKILNLDSLRSLTQKYKAEAKTAAPKKSPASRGERGSLFIPGIEDLKDVGKRIQDWFSGRQKSKAQPKPLMPEKQLTEADAKNVSIDLLINDRGTHVVYDLVKGEDYVARSRTHSYKGRFEGVSPDGEFIIFTDKNGAPLSLKRGSLIDLRVVRQKPSERISEPVSEKHGSLHNSLAYQIPSERISEPVSGQHGNLHNSLIYQTPAQKAKPLGKQSAVSPEEAILRKKAEAILEHEVLVPRTDGGYSTGYVAEIVKGESGPLVKVKFRSEGRKVHKYVPPDEVHPVVYNSEWGSIETYKLADAEAAKTTQVSFDPKRGRYELVEKNNSANKTAPKAEPVVDKPAVSSGNLSSEKRGEIRFKAKQKYLESLEELSKTNADYLRSRGLSQGEYTVHVDKGSGRIIAVTGDLLPWKHGAFINTIALEVKKLESGRLIIKDPNVIPRLEIPENLLESQIPKSLRDPQIPKKWRDHLMRNRLKLSLTSSFTEHNRRVKASGAEKQTKTPALKDNLAFSADYWSGQSKAQKVFAAGEMPRPKTRGERGSLFIPGIKDLKAVGERIRNWFSGRQKSKAQPKPLTLVTQVETKSGKDAWGITHVSPKTRPVVMAEAGDYSVVTAKVGDYIATVLHTGKAHLGRISAINEKGDITMEGSDGEGRLRFGFKSVKHLEVLDDVSAPLVETPKEASSVAKALEVEVKVPPKKVEVLAAKGQSRVISKNLSRLGSEEFYNTARIFRGEKAYYQPKKKVFLKVFVDKKTGEIIKFFAKYEYVPADIQNNPNYVRVGFKVAPSRSIEISGYMGKLEKGARSTLGKTIRIHNLNTW